MLIPITWAEQVKKNLSAIFILCSENTPLQNSYFFITEKHQLCKVTHFCSNRGTFAPSKTICSHQTNANEKAVMILNQMRRAVQRYTAEYFRDNVLTTPQNKSYEKSPFSPQQPTQQQGNNSSSWNNGLMTMTQHQIFYLLLDLALWDSLCDFYAKPNLVHLNTYY